MFLILVGLVGVIATVTLVVSTYTIINTRRRYYEDYKKRRLNQIGRIK